MKSPHESDLPLSCRFTRWWGALAGNSAPRVTRHLATCACCREHFAVNRALENRMRSAAARPTDVPAGFEARLSRAVQVAMRETPAEPSGSSFGFWAFLGSVGVGAAVIAVIFFNAPQSESPQGPIQLVEEHTAESPAPTRSLASNLPSGDALVRTIAQDPLQEEIDLVYADARAALQFLARNFLPETATEADDSSGTTS